LKPLPKSISTSSGKNPELATSLGEHRYDDRLSDYSQAGIQAQVQFQRQSVERLGQIEVSKLSAVNRIDFGDLAITDSVDALSARESTRAGVESSLLQRRETQFMG
jgi:uncharacterized protein (DUF885 family)